MLDLPNSPNIFPTFHTSNLLPNIENDVTLFLNREFGKPPPIIMMEDSSEEYFIQDIIDEQQCEYGYQYLVHWVSYGPEEDCWLSGIELKDTKALDIWLAKSRQGWTL